MIKILKRLIEHHDILRTVFVKDGNNFWQSIKSISDTNVDLEIYDLGDEKLYFEEALKIKNRIHEQIDIFNGPIIKFALLKYTTSCKLMLVIHHLVVDGVSWRILLEDLDSLFDLDFQNQKLKEISSFYFC